MRCRGAAPRLMRALGDALASQEEGLDPERLSRTYAALMSELQEVAGMGVHTVELTPATLAHVLQEGEGLLPFVQDILHFEYGQLFPLAALLSSCFRCLHVPFYTMCTLPFPSSHTSPAVVRTGMCQSLPGATFSSVAMVWTCY